jgi:hypothetical protein
MGARNDFFFPAQQTKGGLKMEKAMYDPAADLSKEDSARVGLNRCGGCDRIAF